MTSFNLNDYIKAPDIDNDSADTLPLWVSDASEKVKAAYTVAVTMEKNIRKKIDSGENLSAKNRKLVLAQIASAVSVDRSYLTERRTPNICRFVKETNEDLEKFWTRHNSKASGRSSVTKKSLTKDLMKYKRLYLFERDKNYSEAVSAMLESELYGKSTRMVQKCAELENRNEQLNKTISNLRSKLRLYEVKKVT